MRAFSLSLGMMLFLVGTGCTSPLEGRVARLQHRVRGLAQDLRTSEKARQEDRRTVTRLRRRIARLEVELRSVRRRLAGRGTPPGPPARAGASAPTTTARCPADLPSAARKVRRRMRWSAVKALLTGTRFRVSTAITLTDAGTRTARVVVGPCFRVTFHNDRVSDVALEGVMPRPASRRRRRHRRRRR